MLGLFKLARQQGPERQRSHFDTFQLCTGGLQRHDSGRALVDGTVRRHHGDVQEQFGSGRCLGPGCTVEGGVMAAPAAGGQHNRDPRDQDDPQPAGTGGKKQSPPVPQTVRQRVARRAVVRRPSGPTASSGSAFGTCPPSTDGGTSYHLALRSGEPCDPASPNPVTVPLDLTTQ